MIGRLLRLEPAAVGSAALTVYVAAAMLYRAFVAHDVAPLDTDVLVAGLGALWGLRTRAKVTPLAEPKDANRVRLVPIDQTVRRAGM